ncbi:mediator of RNA polymerase II transcription subunit 1-like isoform X2 [Dermochelys coriacea]|uniref:mediator of RNA polymerase II transcription subunit 1-like isoform X2 n=1 Tax=Dermochelys coriacea TaxID=27794 RepID=UPI001CA90F42|nr:mediator of RNA polymerase II transcription subunit 1-like isoform X2 [Dermochelys coriacea]
MGHSCCCCKYLGERGPRLANSLEMQRALGTQLLPSPQERRERESLRSWPQPGSRGSEAGAQDAADPVKFISTNALMDKLHLKYAQKTWIETLKLVRLCMDKPPRGSIRITPHHPLLSCLEKIQRTLNAKSLSTVMSRLEFLSKQRGLKSHISLNGTVCYLTSDMFYVEVQLEKDGKVIDVKLAHPGEAPVVCDDLVQLLRMKNYDAFGKILEGLLNLYQIPGNSDMKAKVYLALQSLEKDLYSMSLLYRTQDVNRVTEVLHGKAGHVVPRTGGSQVCGIKVFVTVGSSNTTHKLPISPLIVDSQAGDGNPAFLPLTDELSMDLSACFFLMFHQPFPVSSSNIQEIQKFTGVLIDGLKLASLHALIVQFTLNDEYKEDLSMNNSCFFVSLPDCPKHSYFINKGTEKLGTTGALVSKIPFTHPKCVPAIIEILRHQVTYNTLIGSCVSENTTNKDCSEVLYFEVSPQKGTSFSISFQHPMGDSLACVVADVLSSRQIRCSLHTNPQDVTLNCCNDFITRVMERCMSVPLVMRAIFKNAVTMKIDGEIQNMEAISEQNPEVTCKQTASSNSTGANLSGTSMQNSGMEASSSRVCDL